MKWFSQALYYFSQRGISEKKLFSWFLLKFLIIFFFQKNLGISGSGDSEIHVWAFDDQEIEKVIPDPIIRLTAHESVVNQVELFQLDRVLSSSHDQTAQIHDIQSSRHIQSIRHPSGLTTCSTNQFKEFEIVTAQIVSSFIVDKL